MTEQPTIITDAQNTWCPGCGNFAIQHSLKAILSDLQGEERDLSNVVLVSGIGCHAKIADYLNINSFYSIHGRTLPVATGIVLANPQLNVICCAGDGDMYAEGLDHLIFAAKRDIDLTVVVHDNRVYGLTTGQYTPTSPVGFRGRSTPSGIKERPINPLALVLASGGTFVARSYTGRPAHLKRVLSAALSHKGFSFVEVLQICATYNNLTAFYHERVLEVQDNEEDINAAWSYVNAWDYNTDAKIPLGIFFKEDLPPDPSRSGEKPYQGGAERDVSSAIAAILHDRV